MGIHKARLTQDITNARCSYLWGQYRRGHLNYIKDVVPVIERALPVRENEVASLKQEFVRYMGEAHDLIVCDECGVFTVDWDYYDDQRLCRCCRENLNGE